MKKFSAVLILTVLLMAFVSTPFAQSTEAEPSAPSIRRGSEAEQLELNWDYLKEYVSDTKGILTSPYRWEKSDWLKASLIAGITIGLYALDEEIQDFVQNNRSDTSDGISKYVENVGNVNILLPSVGLLYLYSHYSDDEKAGRVALLSLKSLVISGVFTNVLKFSTHRHRPNSGALYDTWDGPAFVPRNLSFPSGHSSAVFSVMTVVASEYGDKPVVPPLAYGIATLVALSRINDNKHYASDVFFGSAIGYFTAKAVIHYHGAESLSVIPAVGEDGAMLMFSYRF